MARPKGMLKKWIQGVKKFREGVPLNSNLSRAMKIYNRDRGVCWLCGKAVPHPILETDLLTADNVPSMDHAIPRSLGGTTKLENLLLAHLRCNIKRGNSMKPFRRQTITARLREGGFDFTGIAENPEFDTITGKRACEE